MMIDVALEVERTQGKKPVDAIYEACLLSFRPIMMTTMAALLGRTAAGARHRDGLRTAPALGITIVGGLIVSQALTLFTTPVVYVYLDRYGWRCAVEKVCPCPARRGQARLIRRISA